MRISGITAHRPRSGILVIERLWCLWMIVGKSSSISSWRFPEGWKPSTGKPSTGLVTLCETITARIVEPSTRIFYVRGGRRTSGGGHVVRWLAPALLALEVHCATVRETALVSAPVQYSTTYSTKPEQDDAQSGLGGGSRTLYGWIIESHRSER